MSRLRRVAIVRLAAALATALATPRALADVAEPAPRPNEQFDFMNLITRAGVHDIDEETWNAYGQVTYISSWKLRMPAAYENLNGSNSSLIRAPERSWTGTFTVWVGAKLWPGAEAYFVPEVVAEEALSGLKGLGGTIQNFELQKQGSTTPTLYRSRAFVQQRFELGGKRIIKESDPMQLGTTVDSRRLVLRVGNFSVIDFFDKNTFAGDLRRQFFNMAFMTYASFDFAADARGFSWGGVAELDWDDWVVRVGRVAAPQNPNDLPLSFALDKFYGDEAEIEHQHRLFGREGAVRVLAYRNRENMGRFDEAVAAFAADPTKNAAGCAPAGLYTYGSTNATAPDLCWVRRPNVKVGIGLNLEQRLTDDIGVFFRGMYSDGRTEVYAYNSVDRSISFGALATGGLWRRPGDAAGVGAGLGWISDAHARYLAMGGVDGFIGDGALSRATESVVEAFYSLHLYGPTWISGDVQHITNPAFNADRGPANILGARFHAEF